MKYLILFGIILGSSTVNAEEAVPWHFLSAPVPTPAAVQLRPCSSYGNGGAVSPQQSCLGPNNQPTTLSAHWQVEINNQQSAINDGEVGTRCDAAYKKTKMSCNGILFSNSIMPMLQQFQASQSSGNIKDMCDKATKLNLLSSGLNLGFAISCQKAQASCVAACEKADESGMVPESGMPYDEKLAYCQGQQMITMLGYLQTVQSASQAVGSAACSHAASGKCMGDNAYEDQECVQFCQKPGRQTHPKCQYAMNNCSDATYRSQNAQMCDCLTGVTTTGCGLNLPPIDLGTTANLDDPFAGMNDLPGIHEFNGNNPTGNGSNVEGASGGGSGFSGGGGGSAPYGQNDNEGGSDDEALNKDILGGQSSGAGAMVGGGSGGYEGGGSAKSGSGGSGSSSDGLGFDLRAFLPGGKKDPKRGIASGPYSDQTITEANGLSNFQKVTRRINQKKPELSP